MALSPSHNRRLRAGIRAAFPSEMIFQDGQANTVCGITPACQSVVMPATFERVGLVEGGALELRFGLRIESAPEVHKRLQLRLLVLPLSRAGRGAFFP